MKNCSRRAFHDRVTPLSRILVDDPQSLVTGARQEQCADRGGAASSNDTPVNILSFWPGVRHASAAEVREAQSIHVFPQTLTRASELLGRVDGPPGRRSAQPGCLGRCPAMAGKGHGPALLPTPPRVRFGSDSAFRLGSPADRPDRVVLSRSQQSDSWPRGRFRNWCLPATKIIPNQTVSATDSSARAAAPGGFALRNAAGSPPPAPAGCRRRRALRRGRARRRCAGLRARLGWSVTDISYSAAASHGPSVGINQRLC
jgi:hypothetical protein